MKQTKYTLHPGAYPQVRMRRIRQHPWTRMMVAENQLTVHDLIWPVFVQEGEGQETPVDSMPGVSRLSIDLLIPKVQYT